MNFKGVQITQRGYLICFVGVDGSGKTTHAKRLTVYLKQKHDDCSYVWGASRIFLSYGFFALTRVLGYWKFTKKNAYTDPLEFAPSHIRPGLGTVLRFLYFVDYQIKITAKIRFPLLFGRFVVCDRYFYDMLMELELSKVNSARFTSLLSNSLPRPNATFLMTVPDVIAKERRGFPSNFFSRRNKVLRGFSETFNFLVVDSSKTLEENQKFIREVVDDRMKGSKEQR